MRQLSKIPLLGIFALFPGFFACSAAAQTGQYLFTGSETNITLSPGLYNITAYGATGGSATYNGLSGGIGGLGAEMEGEFNFTTTTTLTILAGGGGEGGYDFTGGGGGGGSFVFNGATALVVAGGGGGGGSEGLAYGDGWDGGNGGTGTSGNDGNYGASGGSGGAGGSGGGGYIPGPYDDGAGGGGGGGGCDSNGSNGGSGASYYSSGGGGGSSYASGASGGYGYYSGYGGYGGGGGGGYGGGAGGGGYSGGGGGNGGYDYGDSGGGGGGGSIIDSSALTNLVEISGIASPDDSPNGEVIISPVQPTFSISHSGHTVTVYWQNLSGWSLQQNTNLASPSSWTPSSGVTTNNGTNCLSIVNPTGNLFFRLSFSQ